MDCGGDDDDTTRLGVMTCRRTTQRDGGGTGAGVECPTDLTGIMLGFSTVQ